MKTTRLFILFIGITGLGFGQEPTFDWGITIGGPDFYGGSTLTNDNSGNPIIGGGFANEVTFDQNSTTLDAGVDEDGFIAKYDKADGSLIWLKQIRSFNGGNVSIIRILVSSNNLIYITGALYDVNGSDVNGSADLNPDSNVDEIITNNLETDETGFVLCLDENGNYLWSKHLYVSTPYLSGVEIINFKILDQDELLFSIYVDTDLYGDFEFGSGQTIDIPDEQDGCLLIKTDAYGNIIFSNLFDGSFYNPYFIMEFAQKENGDIITVGRIGAGSDIDPDPLNVVIPSDTLTLDVIAHFDNNGNYLNHYPYDLVGEIDASGSNVTKFKLMDIEVDSNQDICVVGQIYDTVDIDFAPLQSTIIDAPIYTSVGVIKYNNNLDLLWHSVVSPFEGPDGTPGGPQRSITQISVDDTRTFIWGDNSSSIQCFNDTLTLLAEDQSTLLFIGELDNFGGLIWTKNISGKLDWNKSGLQYNNGDYFVLSNSSNSIDLDPDSGVVNSLDYGRNANLIKLSDGTSNLTELTSSKTLIQILDLMGRETTFKPNTPLIYVYDDGSLEKVFSVEY